MSNTIDALSVYVKHFDALTTRELYEMIKARFNVFYLEQAIRYPDLDDVDYNAYHVLAMRGDAVVAYARLFMDENDKVWYAGRVLSVSRATGLGRMVMEKAEAFVRSHGGNILRVHAQIQAESFYVHLGYTRCSEEFVEADILHVGMQKPL